MRNITKLNELISAGAKLVCDKIGIPLRNPNENIKYWMEDQTRRTNTATKSESVKEGKTHNDTFGMKRPRQNSRQV